MESFGEGANILIVKTKEAHALRELSVLWGEEKKNLKLGSGMHCSKYGMKFQKLKLGCKLIWREERNL